MLTLQPSKEHVNICAAGRVPAEDRLALRAHEREDDGGEHPTPEGGDRERGTERAAHEPVGKGCEQDAGAEQQHCPSDEFPVPPGDG